MARTDYIQPDPIKPYGSDQQKVVRGTANTLRERMKVNPGVGYKQQFSDLGNNVVDYTAGVGKSLLGGIDTTRDFLSQGSNGMTISHNKGANTQSDLGDLGNSIQGVGRSILSGFNSLGRDVARPFEQGGAINNLGHNLGGTIYEAINQAPQFDATPDQGHTNYQSVTSQRPINQELGGVSIVGSPEARAEHANILAKYNVQNTPSSTQAPGTNQTSKYRDASIFEGKVDREGDRLGVTFGGGKGKVSGLNPEQASRIQNSLALGDQSPGFNMGNIINSTRSDADAKIMQAVRSGDITADRASALMNRDFRANDRIESLGGNSESYISHDSAPTDIKSAISYAQNINNFSRNGQLNQQQALAAQKNYINSLSAFRGSNAQNENTAQIKKGKKTAFKPAFNDDFISQLPEEYRNNARLTSAASIMELRKNVSKLSSFNEIMNEINEFAQDSKLPSESIMQFING